MDLMSLLIWVIVFGLLFWLINAIIPLAQPFRTAANVILTVILILWLFSALGVIPHHTVSVR